MPEPKPWSDEFIRHLIAKGALTPPPLPDPHMPRWYWPVIIVCTLVAMGAAFYYGVHVK